MSIHDNWPSRGQAQEILHRGEILSPGAWVAHSRMVAQSAESLAKALNAAGIFDIYVDSEKAWVLGLLHDIGRQEGLTDMLHVTSGYDYLMHMGYPEAARVCLTHSFPIKNIDTASAGWQGKEDEKYRVEDFLKSITYDIYDKLIQLCDSVCLTSTTVPLEIRFVEVALRRGIHEKTVDKWNALLHLRGWFQSFLNEPVYSYLPDFTSW